MFHFLSNCIVHVELGAVVFVFDIFVVEADLVGHVRPRSGLLVIFVLLPPARPFACCVAADVIPPVLGEAAEAVHAGIQVLHHRPAV